MPHLEESFDTLVYLQVNLYSLESCPVLGMSGMGLDCGTDGGSALQRPGAPGSLASGER